LVADAVILATHAAHNHAAAHSHVLSQFAAQLQLQLAAQLQLLLAAVNCG